MSAESLGLVVVGIVFLGSGLLLATPGLGQVAPTPDSVSVYKFFGPSGADASFSSGQRADFPIAGMYDRYEPTGFSIELVSSLTNGGTWSTFFTFRCTGANYTSVWVATGYQDVTLTRGQPPSWVTISTNLASVDNPDFVAGSTCSIVIDVEPGKGSGNTLVWPGGPQDKLIEVWGVPPPSTGNNPFTYTPPPTNTTTSTTNESCEPPKIVNAAGDCVPPGLDVAAMVRLAAVAVLIVFGVILLLAGLMEWL